MIRAVVPSTLDELVAALSDALTGDGPAVAPAAKAPVPDLPDGTALVVRTSGSTGTPRDVLLSAAALRASGTATHQRLGGPGHWVLTLPPQHVAGAQVVARAQLAGRGLTVPDDDAPFSPSGFADLAARSAQRAAGERRYVSLVPTQAHRLVAAADAGEPPGLTALAGFAAVLLGGAPTPPPLRARLLAAGVPVVVTYGMTETCGGCVYDGHPLTGVSLRLDAAGGIELSGPQLATGYLNRPELTAAAFTTDDGGRWFRTRDFGVVANGRLQVLGRLDDVIVTGGIKVAPAAVEATLAALEQVREVCVVGLPDAEWGQRVVAVVVPTAPGTTPAQSLTEAARERVAATLGRAAAPRECVLVANLPRLGPGKVNRDAVAELARQMITNRRMEQHGDLG